jgi:hypothetical protein
MELDLQLVWPWPDGEQLHGTARRVHGTARRVHGTARRSLGAVNGRLQWTDRVGLAAGLGRLSPSAAPTQARSLSLPPVDEVSGVDTKACESVALHGMR